MKKLGVLVLLVVALTLVCVGVAQAATWTAEYHDLVTGRKLVTNAGTVKVERVDDTLIVTFYTYPGWYMTETAVAVGASSDDIPQTNGNPVPGQFPSKKYYDPATWKSVHEIDVSDYPEGSLIYVAAHAALVNDAGETPTGWGTGCRLPKFGFSGANWARFFTYGDLAVPVDGEPGL